MSNFGQFSQQSKPRYNKYRHNDWICKICNNYNYSFRQQCNRCHAVPRKITYNVQHNINKSNRIVKNCQYGDRCMMDNIGQNNFPNFVFLALSEQCSVEESKLERWDLWENLNQNKWIYKIIQ